MRRRSGGPAKALCAQTPRDHFRDVVALWSSSQARCHQVPHDLSVPPWIWRVGIDCFYQFAQLATRSRWSIRDSPLLLCRLAARTQSSKGATSQLGKPGAVMDTFGDRCFFQKTNAVCGRVVCIVGGIDSGHFFACARVASPLASPSIRRGQEEGTIGVPFRFPPIHARLRILDFKMWRKWSSGLGRRDLR